MQISLVIPIFNEERLIVEHLELATPHVDEIILIDGSPTGPSTDNTRDLIEEGKFDNVKLIEGTFELSDRQGGWDRGTQIDIGVEAADGDILIVTSCDCVYEYYGDLREVIDSNPKGQVFYCFAREFFIDTKHVRLAPMHGYPLPQVGHVIMTKAVFDADTPAKFDTDAVEQKNFIYMPDINKFHYGWVTDFDKQVQKHLRNVRSGGWGDFGDEILSGGECAVETWAITHVLNYGQEISFVYTGVNGHPFDAMEFSHLQKFEDVLSKFKKKHKKDYYDCV